MTIRLTAISCGQACSADKDKGPEGSSSCVLVQGKEEEVSSGRCARRDLRAIKADDARSVGGPRAR